MARLKLEKHMYPGKLIARMGDQRATLVYHICNGKLIYGFDQVDPPAELGARLARTNEKKLAAMCAGAA